MRFTGPKAAVYQIPWNALTKRFVMQQRQSAQPSVRGYCLVDDRKVSFGF